MAVGASAQGAGWVGVHHVDCTKSGPLLSTRPPTLRLISGLALKSRATLALPSRDIPGWEPSAMGTVAAFR